jgi:hypothetical protein
MPEGPKVPQTQGVGTIWAHGFLFGAFSKQFKPAPLPPIFLALTLDDCDSWGERCGSRPWRSPPQPNFAATPTKQPRGGSTFFGAALVLPACKARIVTHAGKLGELGIAFAPLAGVIPARNNPIPGACEKSIHASTKSYASEFFGSLCGITPSSRKLVKRGAAGGRDKAVIGRPGSNCRRSVWEIRRRL